VIKRNKLTERHTAIAELVKTHAIEDQGMLIDLLKEKFNIETNQAAISRDIRALGITKKARGKQLVYELPDIDAVTEILHYAVESVQHNEAMIIVNTVSGTADMVGDFLDTHKNDLGILATLAGENVVFIAPKSIKNIEALCNKLSQYLKIKE
jgi:transcriptional regulator of arginine metabolism